jgi:hypothetical protein
MSLGSVFKKVVRLSNPVTAAVDITNQAFGANTIKTPHVKVAGMNVDLADMTSPQTALVSGVENAQAYEAHRKDVKNTNEQNSNEKADAAEFQKFTDQDLLNSGDPNGQLYVPTYKTGKFADQTKNMLSIFNNRKSQVLSAQATPGVNQTRFN